MRALLPMLVLSMAVIPAAFAGDCGSGSGPNFGNSPRSGGGYSGPVTLDYSGAGRAATTSGGSGGTYASQAPTAANSSTPTSPTMTASQPPTAAAGQSSPTFNTDPRAGSYTTKPAETSFTVPASSGATPNTSVPGINSNYTKVYSAACDCYEFESNIAAVSNTNQIAAQQLLSNPAAAGAVAWTATVEYAHEAAAAKTEPYAIYFCSESVARTTGDSPAAKAEFKKTHEGRLPADTVFDNSGVLRAFDAAGVNIFVKIPLTAENAKLAEKWGAHENTLVIAAPNDEKLKIFNREDCNESNVAEYLMGFKEKYKVWKWKAQLAAVQEHAKK